MTADSNISHQNTKVVLIANWTFPEWDVKHNIPNIQWNIKQLQSVLENKVGIPSENIILIPDKDASAILKEFEKILKGTKGKDSTLIVYYAGHGLPVSNKGLFWATHDTEMDEYDQPYASSAIAANTIKDYLSESVAEKKILICDCCYAADMLKGTAGAVSAFLEINEQKEKIKGTFYMFSSDCGEESWFPLDKADEPTYFTQALLNSFTDGVSPKEQFCTVGNLYDATEENIKELRSKTGKNIPSPRKSENDNVEQFILFENPAYKNQADTDLENILINFDKPRATKWLKENPTHKRKKEVFELLKNYDSAKAQLAALQNLPDNEKGSGLLSLAENIPYVDLFQEAITLYENIGNKKIPDPIENIKAPSAAPANTEGLGKAEKNTALSTDANNANRDARGI